MKGVERDLRIIQKIITYGKEIDEAVALFGNDYETFNKISAYKNSVSMCVMQIGELAGHLTSDFKERYNGMPWKQIKGMRNIVAHEYGNIDLVELWYTAQEDIPALCDYCQNIAIEINQNQIGDQEQDGPVMG